MSLAKYVSLLARSELYFSNLEILAKSDPFEGALSKPNYNYRKWNSISDLTAQELTNVGIDPPMPDMDNLRAIHSYQILTEYWVRRRLYDRKSHYVNCWHVNKFESAAMWSAYAANGEGIAIITNLDKIKLSISSSPIHMLAGMVNYLDFDTQSVDHTFTFPFTKRMSFSHENEFRLFYWDDQIQGQVNQLWQPFTNLIFPTASSNPKKIADIDWTINKDRLENIKPVPGIYVPVNLADLIDRVMVSPTAPSWYLEVVQSITDKYITKTNIVVMSELMLQPPP